MWQGKLLHIHTTPAVREPMIAQQTAQLIEGVGVEGDRYALGTGKYSAFPDIREVTLIEIETLIALKRDHDIDLAPEEHRRNLTTENTPLNHLVGKRFWVGKTLLEGGRLNTPCRYLDLVTGKSVNDILVHRSGLNCYIVKGGQINVGDSISLDNANA
ncbi:MOSC domain-containing protein [Shimia thalassica]|uniref:MOSC domain-containing protein n=1 Tax=Shimia thalassica TaxID=1715693 RepID=UPI0026E3BCB6|nr:MOSC domain-containing protein [Shimia thalassica]MDO6521924.1 MOSC domain-containing protein [Shimia thalassica]